MKRKCAYLSNLIILALSYALIQHNKLHRTKLESIENSVYVTKVTAPNGSVVIPLLQPFVSFRQLFLIAPEFNIVTCVIEKIMSGFRAALFCYLNRPKAFEQDNLTLSAAGWLAPSCSDNNFTLWSWQAVLTYTKRNPTVFLIIRHPFHRFVSSYVDKCVINKRCGCERDLLCFLKRIRSLLYSLHPDNNVKHSPSKRFLEKLPSDSYLIKHFAPLTWYCRSRRFLDSMYVIRLDMLRKDEMADAYDRLLTLVNVPDQQRSYIRAEILRGLPPYATWNRKERFDVANELLSNATLFVIFLELYFYDFMIFNYDLPRPYSSDFSLCTK